MALQQTLDTSFDDGTGANINATSYDDGIGSNTNACFVYNCVHCVFQVLVLGQYLEVW